MGACDADGGTCDGGDDYDDAASVTCNPAKYHTSYNVPVTYDGQALRKSAASDPVAFWAQQAQNLHWFDPFASALDWNPPFARWFVGGTTNACYNAVDRHQEHLASKPAIVWVPEDPAQKRRVITYSDMYGDVQRFANVLISLGVKKGDRVTICLPMVPELLVAMLACSRIGAVHTVIFSGFSAVAVGERIIDSGSQIVITADGGYRRGKIVPLKEIIDDAISRCNVRHVIVLKRTGRDVAMHETRDLYWDDLVASADPSCEAVPLESTHPLFILYTSGTTGKPKGVLHGTGGYLTHIHATFGWAFGAGKDDVYFCTADVGWVTGHSYVAYAPLMHGVTSVMYEGAPDYPNPLRIWDVIRENNVTIFYTTPTLLRMLMRADVSASGRGGIESNNDDNNDNDTLGAGLGDNHAYDGARAPLELDSLRLLGTVGEPINPDVWRWYYKRVGQGRCPIIDTWWQTETGGMLISPLPAIEQMPLKPGSATLPVPGVDVGVVDDDDDDDDDDRHPIPANVRGQLVIRKPWPGMLLTLWGDDVRYESTYWTRYPGSYHPGDYARIDEDGYVWILGRADDVLKVAGHRIGTAEIEDCVTSHESVSESAACGVPDEIKGESIVVFAVPKNGTSDDMHAGLESDLAQKIRNDIGPIATPSAVHVVPGLPKTRSGKIMRRLLKSIALGGKAGDTSTLENSDVVSDIRGVLDAKLGK